MTQGKRSNGEKHVNGAQKWQLWMRLFTFLFLASFPALFTPVFCFFINPLAAADRRDVAQGDDDCRHRGNEIKI